MAKYNLCRNGVLRSLTDPGTGDVSLGWQELEYLVDEETQYNGGQAVTVTSGQVLYLETDLSSRIKVDGIRLYMTSPTSSGTILSEYLNFYYKNAEGDSYSACSKSLEDTYYSATITSPSAPRFIACVISGVNASVYEFEVFNDNIIVAYGENGETYGVALEDTPLGYEGDPQAIALFNNSTGVYNADAYTCVDYTGTDGDEYVEISSSENGTYYALSDGAIMEDDLITSEWRWTDGIFSNTQVSNHKVINTNSVGAYTTPVFKLDNIYNASYFITQGTAVSGTGSISYDENVYNGSIRVKNSDEEPIPIFESYVTYMELGDTHAVIWSPFDNSYIDRESVGGEANWRVGSIAVDWQDGRYAFSWMEGASWYHDGYIKVFNRSGSQLYSKWEQTDYKLYYDDQFQFEGEHGLWAYGNYNQAVCRTLRHYDADLSELGTYSESQQDFLYGLATEYNGRGCWYTNSLDNTLVHMNSSCTKLKTIYLNNPRQITRTTDGGCWVRDSVTHKVYRYDWNGDKVSEFDLPYNALYGSNGLSQIDHDFRDGFWYRHGDLVRHVTSNGVVNVGPVTVVDPNQIRGCPNGCFVHSTDDNKMYWINMNGQIAYTRSMPASESAIIGCFYYGHDEFANFKNKLIPTTYDPVWGSGGTAEWTEVRKDGYFLPKVKYHRAEITLRGDAELEKVIMAPAVKTQDIAPQTSKNMYIKTNIPLGAAITDYSTRLKTWFGLVD